jgi:multiple sugar transport system permease protein
MTAEGSGRIGSAVVAPGVAATPRAQPAAAAGSMLTPRRIGFLIGLVVLSILFLYPFVWLLSASLKTRETVFDNQLIPSVIRWSNYAEIWSRAPVLNWMTNSTIVSLLSAVAVTASSALVAFAFAYFRFPFRNVLFGFVLASMMLPGAVMMVPTFLIWNEVGKIVPPLGVNTLTPLWASNLFGSAFYIFLLRQFFLGLPKEVFEAARVDGASYFTMWRKIAVPLTWPALIVVFVFELKASWTDLMKALIYLRDVNLFTLPRGLQLLVAQENITAGGEGNMQYVMAAAVIITLPMIVVFFLGQRYFVEGIATTGRKG